MHLIIKNVWVHSAFGWVYDDMSIPKLNIKLLCVSTDMVPQHTTHFASRREGTPELGEVNG